jgi:uncharacterized protein YjbJ (UPF0337 family)
MNWDYVKGNWLEVKGRAKEQWGKLTDDQLMQTKGNRDRLVGEIQKAYGYSKERAEKAVSEWESRFDETSRPSSPESW